MGAPVPQFEAADSESAEALLSSLSSISPTERRRHASVFNYWLSIRGDRPFPPIRDLDPLEISDAGPCSLLLEMIGAGEDAEIRHLGHAVKAGADVARVSEAPAPSLLSCIAAKLPIVAATRQALAFENEFASDSGTTRCWVTLLPFSATGTWIDYVYGFVSLDTPAQATEEAAEAEAEEPAAQAIEHVAEAAAEEPAAEAIEHVAEAVADEPIEEAEPEAYTEPEVDSEPDAHSEPEADSESEADSQPAPAGSNRPGFSAKVIASLETVKDFYGTVVEMQPSFAEPAADLAPEAVNDCTVEGPLQSKLAEVRAKADEARMAKLRSNQALYEGLAAAYDFALDAEENAEDYLKLVEAEGIKIQLRSPMAPVVKLAFNGMCDEATIAQLERVLEWALKQDLPRGSLAERIQSEGGLGHILNGEAKAA